MKTKIKMKLTSNLASRKGEKLMKSRNGFTLVELLVAVIIFVILSVLTLSAFNLNAGSERVRTGARQVQGMLEGAKARAFKFQKPVGVRFFIDENFPAEISGMMYIAGQTNPAAGSYETGTLRYIDEDGDSSTAEGIQYAQSQQSTGTAWDDLKDRGMIQAGVRIRIPAKTGKWYTVSSESFLTTSNTMKVTEDLLNVTYAAPVNSNPGEQANPVEYELDLSIVMGALPGEEPVAFSQGIVIDLRSSKVPSNWNLNRWISGSSYQAGDWVAGISGAGLRVFKADNAGTAGGTEPAWTSAVNSTVIDNGITWRCYETPRFDVIFTPQGTLMGSVIAEGLLHFTMAETRDTREVFEDNSVGLPAWDTSDRNSDGDKPDHLGSFRVVTIFPASGAVNVSPIDPTDADDNGIADNIFDLAIKGSTAK